MKKTGLADSPFFPIPKPTGQTVILPQPSSPSELTPIYENGAQNERMSESANVQTPERSEIQMSESSDEQTSERTITRQTYNIFNDQAVTIDRLQVTLRQKKKKHVEKGQLVRMALDIALPKLLKKYGL